MEYQITTERLSKQYKNFKAVDQVSLHIRKRSIYGFLGPNGAGKSTTMKMLLGLTPPSGGTFAIDGLHFPQDRIAILKRIGSFIESPSYYANLDPESSRFRCFGRIGAGRSQRVQGPAGPQVFVRHEAAAGPGWRAAGQAADLNFR